MTPQAFIESRLAQLASPTAPSALATDLQGAIYAAIMSKKFRKFRVPEINKSTVRKHIEEQVRDNQPIKVFFPFGGYKLWRLEEAPEADWAELFSTMYYARWLKPIYDIYSPGVHFEFRFDEVIVEKLNNVSESETRAYRASFENVLAYVARFVPANMKFSAYLERWRYENYEAFERELAVEVEALRSQRAKSPIPLSAKERASIDLNVRLKPGQANDPRWQEENDLVHIAYYKLQGKKHEKKHYEAEGIVAFTVMFNTPNIVAVGTTKTSIAKFWVGVGALKPTEGGYIETVLSPSQEQSAKYDWSAVSIAGLQGKNFKKIRVLKI